MCGIAGIVSYRDGAPPASPDELLRIRDAMAVRGPDGSGAWFSADGRVAFGHRRLAIIDLSPDGAQPMTWDDGAAVITFNGEIYNYRELRQELAAKGYRFRSNSDTEVLLALYAEAGVDMLSKLRGMYTFAIWDAKRDQLFLARDPFGIKPVYFTDDGRTFRFASQVKALMRGGAISNERDPAATVGFLLWGSVPEPFTVYRQVHALPAGAYLTVSRGGVSQRQYFSVADELRSAADRPDRGSEEDLFDAVRDSVRCHLTADVPVGVFLSSGIDSGALAAVVSGIAPRPRTITLGFQEYEGSPADEVPLAERMAKEFGTVHETRRISRADFDSELPRILESMDQPSIDGINTYFVSRAASMAGLKVALSGLGSDELFGGYPGFRQIPRLVRYAGRVPANRLLGRLLRGAIAPLLPANAPSKLAGVLELGGSYESAYLLRRSLHLPWEIEELQDETIVHEGLQRLNTMEALTASIRGVEGTHARIAALELQWYMRNQLLRDSDWAGMAHSLEIRVPFVDVDLFRRVAPRMVAATPYAKSDLARCIRPRLPAEVIARKKTGFSVPVQQWTRDGGERAHRGLKGWAQRVMPRERGPFRILALVPDAFGGRGGIAKFNRDLLRAVSEIPECSDVYVLPRHVQEEWGPLPARIVFRVEASRGALGYLRQFLAAIVRRRFDLLICGHINLAPLAVFAAALRPVKTVMFIHGIDAWTPPSRRIVRWAAKRIDTVVSVSEFTLGRFISWSGYPRERARVLPNCVDVERFSPGEKSATIARTFGLEGRKVLLTIARLSKAERYKGVDEMISAMPALVAAMPDLIYVICGEGDDRARLERRVVEMRLEGFVKFVGYVEEEVKPDLLRVADVFVMPSRGEGFGIVFLEAIACGTPVVAGDKDAAREVLGDGELGEIVDPDDAASVVNGVMRAFKRGRAPAGSVERFSVRNYNKRVSSLMTDLLAVEQRA